MKILRHTTEDEIPSLIKTKFKECPECHNDTLYAGCIENKYDKKLDKEIVISFDVFCSNCGAFITKWDGTDREYYFAKRQ